MWKKILSFILFLFVFVQLLLGRQHAGGIFDCIAWNRAESKILYNAEATPDVCSRSTFLSMIAHNNNHHHHRHVLVPPPHVIACSTFSVTYFDPNIYCMTGIRVVVGHAQGGPAAGQQVRLQAELGRVCATVLPPLPVSARH